MKTKTSSRITSSNPREDAPSLKNLNSILQNTTKTANLIVSNLFFDTFVFYVLRILKDNQATFIIRSVVLQRVLRSIYYSLEKLPMLIALVFAKGRSLISSCLKAGALRPHLVKFHVLLKDLTLENTYLETLSHISFFRCLQKLN